MDDQAKTMKTVYTIVERTPGKSYWVRVGVGFTNRDGSVTLRLDAIPVNGTLQVREWEPAERRSESAERRSEPIDGTSAPRPRARDGASTPAV